MRHAYLPLALGLGIAASGIVAPAAADEKPAPRITVVGEGETAASPDMAILSLSVLREADTARAALDQDNKAMADVIDAMKKTGIADRDLQTSGLSIDPRYSNVKPDSKTQEEPKIIGYRVVNTLTVRVRDLDKLGAVIDSSVSLGVNQGGGITFTNDDMSKPMQDARKRAMEDAIARAKTLTETAGVKTGKIIEISEQSYRPMPRPMAMKARRFAAAAEDSVPVQAGENTYHATVTVTFEINQ
ncbi:MAG: SIMPL domain-containing protein [Hyphomicrobiales bacterium]|nr:SIMPL domain-containing protein [Hyphomicrobiales bacterium]